MQGHHTQAGMILEKIDCPKCQGFGVVSMRVNGTVKKLVRCNLCDGNGFLMHEVTNYDRLQSMNDSELASYLSYMFLNGKCVPQLLDWLRKPAEEE